MATRRLTTRRTPPRTRQRSTVPAFSVSPEVARSLFGLTLLVLGVITLIMIFLPASQGSLTEWAQRTVNPLFGTGRWLLPFLLMAAGAYVEWGGPPAAGWQWRFVAASVVAALCALGFQRRVGVVIALATVGLSFATVYGGFHYAVDALAGAIVGLSVWLTARALWRALSTPGAQSASAA